MTATLTERYDTTGRFALYRDRPSTPPPTASIRDLRAELDRVREVYGRRSTEALEASQALTRAYVRDGRQIDALDSRSPVEEERFFARTAQGPDGHVYWLGARDFILNDNRKVRPRAWWWEHTRTKRPDMTWRIYVTCGDAACINPEHCECRQFQKRIYTDSAILGAIQVCALRLGHTPSRNEWKTMGLRPHEKVIFQRFHSWARAVQAAGLPPATPGYISRTDDECVQAIRVARDVLGRWPTYVGFVSPQVRDRLREDGLPSDPKTIIRHLGTGWRDAIRNAATALKDAA